MHFLVTGGAGFIGANFIFYMMENHPEDQITCLDALTYAGNLKTLDPLMDDPRFTFVRGDIADREQVFDLFGKNPFDVVVNFAAETHVDRSIADPGIFLRTNIIGTQTLMDACREFDVSRFHQVGTDEVYGDLPLDRPDLYFTEKTPEDIQPVFRVKGVRGSSCAGLSSHIWPAGDHQPLFQQLRPVSVSGKAHPADDFPRAGRRTAAGIRNRGKCPGLALRGRPLQGNRHHTPAGKDRRSVQRRRSQRKNEPGGRQNHPPAAG